MTTFQLNIDELSITHSATAHSDCMWLSPTASKFMNKNMLLLLVKIVTWHGTWQNYASQFAVQVWVLASEGWREAWQPSLNVTSSGQRQSWKTPRWAWGKQDHGMWYFSLQCFDTGRQEGHPACKKNWMLVCWWWWFGWSIARLIAPVVQLSLPPPSSFASIGIGWPRFTWKMAVKMESEFSVQVQLNDRKNSSLWNSLICVKLDVKPCSHWPPFLITFIHNVND